MHTSHRITSSEKSSLINSPPLLGVWASFVLTTEMLWSLHEDKEYFSVDVLKSLVGKEVFVKGVWTDYYLIEDENHVFLNRQKVDAALVKTSYIHNEILKETECFLELLEIDLLDESRGGRVLEETIRNVFLTDETEAGFIVDRMKKRVIFPESFATEILEAVQNDAITAFHNNIGFINGMRAATGY